jgi:hypothetical protein
MGWSGLNLTAGQDEDLNAILRRAWLISYADAFLNFRSAVFRKNLPDGGSIVYFSPAAEDLGNAFGARPCIRPATNGLRLVAGDDRAWDCYFADKVPAWQARPTLHLPKRSAPVHSRSASEPTCPAPLA